MVALIHSAGAAMAGQKRKNAEAQPVALYLVEPIAEFQDAALKDRHDTWKDMRFVFSKKLVRLVNSREEATLVVEVVGRQAGTAAGSKVSASPLGGATNQPFEAKVVIVKLAFGNYSTEITGKAEENEYSVGGAEWKSAAFRAVDGIQDWIKANRSKLP
jgi:hypothetical protein